MVNLVRPEAGDGVGEELERRVQEARKDYEVALQRVRKLANPGAGWQEAQRLQSAATERYAAALKALSDYVLGRAPAKSL